MLRYSVSQFDVSTYVVYDLRERREVCICGNYDDRTDAEHRGRRIAALLNESEPPADQGPEMHSPSGLPGANLDRGILGSFMAPIMRSAMLAA